MMTTLIAATTALVLPPAHQPPVAVLQRGVVYSITTREPSRLIFPSTLIADMLDDFASDMSSKNVEAEAKANLVRARMAAAADAEQRAFEQQQEFEARQAQEKAARAAEKEAKEEARQEQLAARAAAQEEAAAAAEAARAERAARGGAPAERRERPPPAVKTDRGDREKPECFYCM